MIRQQYQTYVKVAGEWCYLYRAIDRDGTLVDVYLSATRDMAAAKAFLRSAKSVTQVEPEQVTTDGHTSYPKAIADELGTDVNHRTSQYEGSAPSVRQTTLRSNQSGTSLSLKRRSAIWDTGELVDVFSGRKKWPETGCSQASTERPFTGRRRT